MCHCNAQFHCKNAPKRSLSFWEVKKHHRAKFGRRRRIQPLVTWFRDIAHRLTISYEEGRVCCQQNIRRYTTSFWPTLRSHCFAEIQFWKLEAQDKARSQKLNAHQCYTDTKCVFASNNYSIHKWSLCCRLLGCGFYVEVSVCACNPGKELPRYCSKQWAGTTVTIFVWDESLIQEGCDHLMSGHEGDVCIAVEFEIRCAL